MLYETTLILSPHIDNQKLSDAWEKLLKQVEKAGAKVKKDIKPASKTLAYAMGDKKRGYLATIYLEAESTAPAKLKEVLGEQGDIVRYMLTQIKEVPTPKTATAKEPKENALKEKGLGREKKAQDEPPLEEIDKKLQDILEDKIQF